MRVMELNDESKQIVEELGDAINSAVERSEEVVSAINRIRSAGFELDLTIRLGIGLRARSQPKEYTPSDAPDSGANGTTRLEITDQDLMELRRMKIRFEED